MNETTFLLRERKQRHFQYSQNKQRHNERIFKIFDVLDVSTRQARRRRARAGSATKPAEVAANRSLIVVVVEKVDVMTLDGVGFVRRIHCEDKGRIVASLVVGRWKLLFQPVYLFGI